MSVTRSVAGLESQARPIGMAFFVVVMAVGYYYNVTFVQLGLTDLGGRILGLERHVVAGHMAVLAITTCGAALAAGL
jgi:hypothetical protein